MQSLKDKIDKQILAGFVQKVNKTPETNYWLTRSSLSQRNARRRSGVDF